MAKGYQVLNYLLPNGGWYISGDDFEGIQFLECEPITKAEFEAGFAGYDAWKAQQDAQAQAKRQTLLDKLGITEEEAKLLLGGI
jgi:hypothetical protein